MMKLDYFDLLSPDPVHIQNVGGILSPRLKDISSIGIRAYQYYLSTLFNTYDLLTANQQTAELLADVFNFFIREEVRYSAGPNCFVIQKNGHLTGMITKETYPQVCDIIFQRNAILPRPEEDLSKAKNQKALEIMQKLEKGRKEKARQTSYDQNLELGNIISAVANKSYSLNILNIWDLTVYQIWDCFQRLSSNSIYEIQSMSVATWGDKNKDFDAAAWFKKLHTGN